MSHRTSVRKANIELLEERRVLTTVAWPLPPAGSSEELGERILANFQGTIESVAEQRDFESEQAAIDALGALAVDYWAELLGQDVTAELERPLFPWMPFRFEPVDLFSTLTFSTQELRTPNMTNVRISGVDEADHAEMLGDGLYLVSNGQQAQLFDVSDPENIRWVSDIEVGLNNRFIYDSGKLAVMSVSPRFDNPSFWGGWIAPLSQSARISTFDLSDPSRPSLLSTIEIDGDIHSAHLVDSTLVIGTNFSQRPPELQLVPIEPGESADGGFRFETEQEYLARVSGSLVEHFTGQVRRLDASGSVQTKASAGDFSDVNVAPASHQYVVRSAGVMTFDFVSDTLELIDSESIVGADFAFSYVDADSVYSVQQSDGSTVFEFTYSGAGVEFAASGSVPGQILSTRSMDESGGVLRVFTSASGGFFGDERSDLYVLESVDGSLETLGQLINIAEGQSQYGVMFDGDVAYITTAEFSPNLIPIDPLHVIDLSDPAMPIELSELEIPGVVTSLRRVDESHLVGIGFAVTETDGILSRQITLFDVSDLAAPKIVKNWVGGDETSVWRLFGDWSASEMNIRFTADAGLLTIDSGLAEVEVFRIDPSGVDAIQHVVSVGDEAWVDPHARSFVDDTHLVVAANGTLKVVSLDEPDQVVGQVALGDPLVPDNEWIYSDALEVELRPLENDRSENEATITRIKRFQGVARASIGEDGRSIILHREHSTFAEVRIDYEITLADGRVLESTLTTTIRPQEFVDTPEIEYADASASFMLSAADDNGDSVTMVAVGDEVWVTLTADWDGSDMAGVFAAHADIRFDTSLLEVTEIEHLNGFDNGTAGELTGEGLINLGGFIGDVDGDVPGAVEIARFCVKVVGEGDLRFEVSASQGVAFQFLVFGESHPMDRARITGLPLVLSASSAGESDTQSALQFQPTDIDQDGYTSAIDALYLINEINRRVVSAGSGEQSSLITDDESGSSASPMLQRMDVSGDGHLSAIDVLHVVNYINANVSSQIAEGESVLGTPTLSESDFSAMAAAHANQWAEELRKGER